MRSSHDAIQKRTSTKQNNWADETASSLPKIESRARNVGLQYVVVMQPTRAVRSAYIYDTLCVVFTFCLDGCARELYRNLHLMNHRHHGGGCRHRRRRYQKELLKQLCSVPVKRQHWFKITSSSRTHLRCLNGVATGCWITHQLLLCTRVVQPAFQTFDLLFNSIDDVRLLKNNARAIHTCI